MASAIVPSAPVSVDFSNFFDAHGVTIEIYSPVIARQWLKGAGPPHLRRPLSDRAQVLLL